MILFVDSTMSPFFFIALTTAANLVRNDHQEIQNSDQNNGEHALKASAY